MRKRFVKTILTAFIIAAIAAAETFAYAGERPAPDSGEGIDFYENSQTDDAPDGTSVRDAEGKSGSGDSSDAAYSDPSKNAGEEAAGMEDEGTEETSDEGMEETPDEGLRNS